MSKNNDFDANIIRGITCHLVSIDPVLLKHARHIDLCQDNSIDELQAIIHKVYTESGIENNLCRYLAGEPLPGAFIVDMSSFGRKIELMVSRSNHVSVDKVAWMSPRFVWGVNAAAEHHGGIVHLVDDIC